MAGDKATKGQAAAIEPAPDEHVSEAVVEPVVEAAAQPAAAAETLMADQETALLERFASEIAAHGAAAVDIAVLRRDADGAGGVLSLTARTRDVVRSAASALLHSEDGREWKFLGDGPAGENEDQAAAYLHVSPLA
jgi:hypothetical protein